MVLTAYLELVSCARVPGTQCDFAGPQIGDCAVEAETYIRDSARVLRAPTCSKTEHEDHRKDQWRAAEGDSDARG
jgi:hypothetical protein